MVGPAARRRLTAVSATFAGEPARPKPALARRSVSSWSSSSCSAWPTPTTSTVSPPPAAAAVVRLAHNCGYGCGCQLRPHCGQRSSGSGEPRRTAPRVPDPWLVPTLPQDRPTQPHTACSPPHHTHAHTLTVLQGWPRTGTWTTPACWRTCGTCSTGSSPPTPSTSCEHAVPWGEGKGTVPATPEVVEAATRAAAAP